LIIVANGPTIVLSQTLIKSDSHAGGKAAVDFYFIQDDGGSFKATVPFEPYFFVGCRAGSETQVEEWLIKKYEGFVIRTERRKKWDLSVVCCGQVGTGVGES